MQKFHVSDPIQAALLHHTYCRTCVLLLSTDSDLIDYGWCPCSSVITRCPAAVKNYTAGQEALYGLVICGSALEFLPDAPKP